MNGTTNARDALELVHPLYLDVPMMISFLAALEGHGIAFEGEELARSSSGGSQEREAGGRVGLPAIGALFGIDLTGRLQSASEEEESRETKVLRRHTEASLFNLLRHRLISEGRVHEASRPEELAVGELVEVQGNYVGNALQELVDLFMKLLPYTGIEDEAEKGSKKKNPKKSGNPAVRAQAATSQAQEEDMPPTEILKMMKIVREDLTSSAVEDAVVDASDGLRVVLTMSKEFLSPETRAQMLAARLRVLGKVSRVLGPGETINLTRRTAIGVTGPEVARELVQDTTEHVDSELGDPVVESPGIQIQPLAVFL